MFSYIVGDNDLNISLPPQPANTMSHITLPFFCILITSSVLYQATADGGSIKQDRPTKKMMREKLSHFTFYWQDILGGPNPTAIPILKAVSNTTYFGAVTMIDDALTEKRDPKSKVLGRAQGFYAGASLQKEGAALMAMNFVFLTGKYNGSTLTILGRNPVFNPMREMPVVGGSGLFRFARGYVQARTKMINITNGDATVKYDVYVMHYVY